MSESSEKRGDGGPPSNDPQLDQSRNERLEVSVTIPTMTRLELWDMLWRESLVQRWLGKGSLFPLNPGRGVLLSEGRGPWRQGTVSRVKRTVSVQAAISPRESWGTTSDDDLTISVEARPEGGTVLNILETGACIAEYRSEIERFWADAVRRLKEMVRLVDQRRDSPRQALIVIHGIGEQEPGRTLSALADSGVLGEHGQRSFVKPDLESGSFELRRLLLEPVNGRSTPPTDVYEFYWAHIISDTTTAQVGNWLRRLILRTSVPRPLMPLWVLTWVVAASVLVALLGQLSGLWDIPSWAASLTIVLGLAAIIWRIVGRTVLTDVLGDAARYLSPRPANIGQRQAIRQAGVDLLERLHDRGIYDRIVILGHSLGSVIAYDLVTYSWINLHAEHGHLPKPSFRALASVESAVANGVDEKIAQDVQHRAWKQVRCNGQPWLVTDLVTVGSPLTYADFLMADNRTSFAKAKNNRLLPMCPPVVSPHKKSTFKYCTYQFPYSVAGNGREPSTFTTFDHGAPFAVTRWTNLYFASKRWGLEGDLVGGPLRPVFGDWIKDVEMTSPVRRFSHNLYWRSSLKNGRARNNSDDASHAVTLEEQSVPPHEQEHLKELRNALSLRSGRELRELASQIPACIIAERAYLTSRMRP